LSGHPSVGSPTGASRLLWSVLGRTRYADVWDLQKALWTLRSSGRIEDLLLFTEHEHVYTIGKSGNENHLLATEEELRRTGVDVFAVDRGGDITYHGPGQLVGYPILDLHVHGEDLHRYLRNLEEVLIRVLASFAICGVREEGMTGVWVGGEKIAAIGVKVSRWTTMHGFALNVNTDIAKFGRIIPCGIFHKGVTSMERLLGASVDMQAVIEHTVREFAEVFGCAAEQISQSTLQEYLG
jgi:lipoate-protein ligase B